MRESSVNPVSDPISAQRYDCDHGESERDAAAREQTLRPFRQGREPTAPDSAIESDPPSAPDDEQRDAVDHKRRTEEHERQVIGIRIESGQDPSYPDPDGDRRETCPPPCELCALGGKSRSPAAFLHPRSVVPALSRRGRGRVRSGGSPGTARCLGCAPTPAQDQNLPPVRDQTRL